MKTYRRIEITVFSRSIMIATNDKPGADDAPGVVIARPNFEEPISIESNEGQTILLEALRLLEEKIMKRL